MKKRSVSLWLVKYSPLKFAALSILLALGLNVRIWPFEFFASFLPQLLIMIAAYFLLYTALIAWRIFIYGRSDLLERVSVISWSALVIGGATTAYVLAHSVNIVNPILQPDVDANFTVGTFNKLYRSSNFASDSSFILASRPDVFSVQEVTTADIEYLKTMTPHEFSYTTNCGCSALNTEVAVLSKHPIVNAMNIYEHEDSVIVRTLIDTEQHGQLVFYAVHLHVPYDQGSYSLRDDAFQILTDNINRETLPTFVVGDFNTTVFSPDLQDFISDNKNIEIAAERTWPRCSWYGFGELGCARIDHIFVPTGVVVKGVEIGKESASDHRSVVVELKL